jgi:hypothetical protein
VKEEGKRKNDWQAAAAADAARRMRHKQVYPLYSSHLYCEPVSSIFVLLLHHEAQVRSVVCFVGVMSIGLVVLCRGPFSPALL